MQVNSVSLSQNATNLAFKATPEEQLFANLKDRDLKNIAFAKASKDVNDRKHHNIDKALFLSLPLAGGLSTAVRKYPQNFVDFVKPQNMRAFRLSQFTKSAAGWGAGLAALGVLWNLKDYLAKKVDIIKNNPGLSFIATFAAGFGVLAAVDKVGSKILDKTASSVVNNQKFIKSVLRVRDSLNNSKILNKAAKLAMKFPSPIRDMARVTAEFAPLLVILTQIGHVANHQNVKVKVANKNFNELKQAQEIIKNNLADEKIDNKVGKKSIAQLHNEYEQMLKTKPLINAKTGEPITFDEFVKLATTIV